MHIGPSSLHKLKTTKNKDFLDVLHIGTIYLQTVDSIGRSVFDNIIRKHLIQLHDAMPPYPPIPPPDDTPLPSYDRLRPNHTNPNLSQLGTEVQFFSHVLFNTHLKHFLYLECPQWCYFGWLL